MKKIIYPHNFQDIFESLNRIINNLEENLEVLGHKSWEKAQISDIPFKLAIEEYLKAEKAITQLKQVRDQLIEVEWGSPHHRD